MSLLRIFTSFRQISFPLFFSIISFNSFGQISDKTMPYEDKDFSCINSTKAQQFVRDFQIDVDSFGGLDLCKPEADSKKLFNDLLLIENGKFSIEGDNLFIRNFVPADKYYSWLKSQTQGMNRGNDIPTATAYNSGGYFTMQDGWAKLSTLGRVGTIIHEARHTAGYRHVPCTQGSYAGASVNGCDTNYDYGGSHAVEMEYYANVNVRGQNFHPVYKTMARLMAVARSNFLFNKLPIQKREALLAIESQTGIPYLFDQNTVTQKEKIPHFQGVLKRTSFGASLLKGSEVFAFEMYEKSGFEPLIKDVYSYFKLLDISPKPFKDAEEFDLGAKRWFVAIDDKNQVAAYNFPQGQWFPATKINFNVSRTVNTLSDGQKGYFALDQNNNIYKYNTNSKNFENLNSSWDQNVLSYASYQNNIWALKNSGQIEDSKGIKLHSGYFDQMINVPMYDGFIVKP